MTNGIYIPKIDTNKKDLLNEIKSFAFNNNLKKADDDRIQKCLEILEAENLDYDKVISVLTSKVFLSESRLSHLFKEHIGISIKKYLVWSKLKKAIHAVLNENISLTEASLEVGFYDQAHLSNAFKNVLGIAPSKAYNSRILQL
ncbi:AraC family transcriptional regulator [uncultured Aquimarina sp.]|uniref:helix-turn-helix domain-containing protein n=1 Tax=uncultured Aquimarina sp. TaxID=575652 RepID=UPI002609F025|nr:AraC family transcriptional regulator [uncultured Aquimarina sp.]